MMDHIIGEAFRFAVSKFPLNPVTSIHGPKHWLAVDTNVRVLIEGEGVEDADWVVCRLFAMLHDCARMSEGEDKDHGRRAAALIRTLPETITQAVTPYQLSVLTQAIAAHNEGGTTKNATIGVCWDADRLQLTRPGVELFPSPEFMSTKLGKILAVQDATNLRLYKRHGDEVFFRSTKTGRFSSRQANFREI